MNIFFVVIEVVRTITFFFTCAVAMVFCYNILSYIFGLDAPGRSMKALGVSFVLILLLLVLDNTIFSIYHVHIINTKISLGATPDPIF